MGARGHPRCSGRRIQRSPSIRALTCEAFLPSLRRCRRGGGIGRRSGLRSLCPRGRAGSSPVPGTTETQHPFPEDREALLRVLLDPEAVLSEQSAEGLPGVFRAATERWVQLVDATSSVSPDRWEMVQMTQTERRGISASQKQELWERWKRGQSMNDIARALAKKRGSIHFVLSTNGGIQPSSTIRIFSSAENFRRVLRRMSRTAFSAESFWGMGPTSSRSLEPSLRRSLDLVQTQLTGNSPRHRAATYGSACSSNLHGALFYFNFVKDHRVGLAAILTSQATSGAAWHRGCCLRRRRRSHPAT